MISTSVERYLHVLRDSETSLREFRHASDNLARLLCAEIVARLPHVQEVIRTPVGQAKGPRLREEAMIVPIYRAGQALVGPFLEVVPDAPVGSLLIQRDEETAEPELYYRKFPDPPPPNAIILDPMLATAGSAVLAVNLLTGEGYPAERIYFAGVIGSQPGFNRLKDALPEENIVLAALDPELDERKYIVPGLGDYGDRYFGT